MTSLPEIAKLHRYEGVYAYPVDVRGFVVVEWDDKFEVRIMLGSSSNYTWETVYKTPDSSMAHKVMDKLVEDHHGLIERAYNSLRPSSILDKMKADFYGQPLV